MKARPAIKSNAQSLPIIGWSNASRNHGTMVKIEKAIQEEKESEEIIQNGIDVHSRIIGGDEFPVVDFSDVEIYMNKIKLRDAENPQTPPYVSDDFTIGPDGAYENIYPYEVHVPKIEE